MEYLHLPVDLSEDDVVDVLFDHPANVMLLDETNWVTYQERRSFAHEAGGYVKKSPFRFYPPYAGKWHVVVDLGGGPGSVRASVAIHQEEQAA